ncbi:MAG: PAS domain S-box protein [Pseudomonadota bacterium]|nr:PAS domain S-box protein [Pseudomonadota bacterium]
MSFAIDAKVMREREENKYRLLFEHAGEAIFIVQDGKVVFVNPTTITITGYAAEEIASRPFSDFIHGDDRDLVVGRHARRLRGELPPPRYSFRILHKDGGFRWVELNAALIDWEGRPATLNFMTDVTDRRRAEQALRESENRYSELFERMSSGVAIYEAVDEGRDFVFRGFNAAAERMERIKREEVLGKRVTEVFPGVRDFGLLAVFRRVCKSGRPESRNISFYQDSRIAGWRENHVYKLPSGEIVAIYNDVTERKQAEESLRRMEENYRSIFENAREGIYRTTPEGKFLMANRAMARIMGYETPEELIEGITDIYRQFYIHPEDRARTMELLELQGFSREDELRLKRKDGSVIWVYRTLRGVYDERKKLQYIDGLVLDITDRKHGADQLRKALWGTVMAIVSVVESKDPYTAGHQRRVADISRAIATEMGLSPERIEGIHMAGMIHDIGKISIPAEILSMPRRLTDLEFSLIKTHAQSGYNILKGIEFPWPVARIVLEHHERIDGSGYPNGLSGDQILLEARIVAVADVVEAMATHRPYRQASGLDQALEEITRNRGRLYDSEAVDACLRLFRSKGFTIEA